MAQIIDAIREDRPKCLTEFDPEHPTAFQDYVNTLNAATRDLAKKPLVKGNELLGFDSFKVHTVVHADDSSRRDLPRCAQASGPHIIKLLSRLGHAHTPEHEAPSQVWEVQVSTSKEILVAKIYCPSFTKPVTGFTEGTYEYMTPTQCARIEEAAYAVLAPAQGLWLPYFLGRFQIKLSNGEEAEVNLMEYVPGQMLSDWRDERDFEDYHPESNLHFQELHNEHVAMFKRITKVIESMHEMGIIHSDLHGSNIIIPSDSPESVVFVDFEFARRYEQPKPGGTGSGAIDVRKSVYGFACCEDHILKLRDWCRQNGHKTDWEGHWITYHL